MNRPIAVDEVVAVLAPMVRGGKRIAADTPLLSTGLIDSFAMAELLARLRALARRTHIGATDPTSISVGDLTVDIQARRAFIAGTEIDLRAKEFDLLTVLVQHAGKVLTREQAMSLVWDEHWFGSTKTLDVTMASLRHQLGDDGPTGSRISTLRGIGYRLEVPDDQPGTT